MTRPEFSGADVAVRVPAGLTADELSSPGAGTARLTGLSRALRRVGSGLADLAGLLALVYAFPLVILAIGIPIALLIQLGMWAVRAF